MICYFWCRLAYSGNAVEEFLVCSKTFVVLWMASAMTICIPICTDVKFRHKLPLTRARKGARE